MISEHAHQSGKESHQGNSEEGIAYFRAFGVDESLLNDF